MKRHKTQKKMGKTWKPDKAPGRKRGQKQRFERQKTRKDFAKNMEAAEALAREFYNGTKNAILTVISDVCDLDQKYVDWARNRYRYLKFSEPMTKLHKDMDETWREIVVTREACAKATEARTRAKRMEMHHRAVEAFRKRKFQKRMLREFGMEV